MSDSWKQPLGGPPTHRMSGTPEFKAWAGARERCFTPTHSRYHQYGGRGIRMCERWVHSFETFYADMAPRPSGTSLDREDNDGNYEPGNCRWATPVEQNNNRRYNRTVTIDGEDLTVAQASRRLGIPHSTLLGRLDAGKPIDAPRHQGAGGGPRRRSGHV